jgi:hypothetical protein
MQSHLVSNELLEAAATHVESIFARRPDTAQRWRDMCTTSALSKASGGIVRLETNYDWIVAALMLLSDGQALIPRDKS